MNGGLTATALLVSTAVSTAATSAADVAAAAVPPPPPPPALPPQALEGVPLFSVGDMGYDSFRGTVLLQEIGRPWLIGFACGRKGGGDVSGRDLFLRRSSNGGRSWDAPKQWARVSNQSLLAGDGVYMGSAVFDTRTNTSMVLWGNCLEKCAGQHGNPRRSNETVLAAPSFMMTRSTDSSFETWTTENLTALNPHFPFPVNTYGYGLQDAQGRILFCGPYGRGTAGCMRSQDGGHHFVVLHNTTAREGLTWSEQQMTLLSARGPSTLMMVGHGAGTSEEQSGYLMSFSRNFGESWHQPRGLTALPAVRQPGCQGSLLAVGDTVIISHPNNSTGYLPGNHDPARNHMTLSFIQRGWESNWKGWRHHLVFAGYSGYSAMQDLSVGSAGEAAVGLIYERGVKRFDEDVWVAVVPVKDLALFKPDDDGQRQQQGTAPADLMQHVTPWALKTDDTPMSPAAAPAIFVAPFSFRVRGTPSSWPLDRSGRFQFIFNEVKVSAAVGEWSNWVDFSVDDVKALAAAATNTRQPPSFGRLIVSLRVVLGEDTATYLTANVELQFTRDVAAADPAAKEFTHQLESTLGFHPRLNCTTHQPETRLGIMLAPGNGTDAFQTFRQYNNATFYGSFPSVVHQSRLPKLFPLFERFIGDSDVDNEKQAVAALGRLGYTGLSSTFANGPNTKAIFSAAGVQWVTAGASTPIFSFEPTEHPTDTSGLFDFGLYAGFSPADYKLAKEVDEPGWYYPSTYELAANSSVAIGRWHALLRDVAQLTPAELLNGATKWQDIKFAGRSVANGTVQDRRRFYWTTRFFSLDSSQKYANTTRQLEAALDESGVQVFANWNNFGGRMYVPGPVGHNRAINTTDAAMASHDWYDFGRSRGGSILWTEDWWAPASEWSFYGARMQAAGASLGLPWGAYVVPRAAALRDGDIVQRVATVVGSGGKGIIYYNFGPNYAFPGNCWGVGNDSLSLAPQIQAAHQLLANAEELLWEGVRPAASVAILSPRSSTPWDDLCSLFDDTCLFGADGKQSHHGTRRNRGAVHVRNGGNRCCATPTNIMDATNCDQSERTVDYMAEVYGDYHALAQVHNIPTEFIDETTLAHNVSKMSKLSTLIVSEPNLPAAAAEALIDWVKYGGHLVLICAGAVLDEYNSPAPTVWQQLGLKKPDKKAHSFASWAPAARMNVHVAGEDVWGPSTVVDGSSSGLLSHSHSLKVKAFGRICLGGTDDVDLGEGTVLAKFSNGSTAASLHTVGKGSVMRFSWFPGVSHSAAMYPGRHPPGQARPSMLTDASKWLAVAVGLARNPSREHVTTATVDVAQVETPVLLSSSGAVVTILDWRPAGTNRAVLLRLNVSLPFKPHSVHSASAGALAWQPIGSSRSWHRGLVDVPCAKFAADFVSFRSRTTLKSDDNRAIDAGFDVSAMTSHVPKWLSMFNPDFDAAGQHSFANLGMSGQLNELVNAHTEYGMRGFLSIQKSDIWRTVASGHRNQNESGLQDGWMTSLKSVLTTAEPYLRSGVLAGIFLGDERCCSGIPFTNVSAVADAVKRFLNRSAPKALVYLNECSTPFDDCQKYNPSISCWGATVPDSIDLISLDIYHHAGQINPAFRDPSTEVNTARKFVNAHVIPKLNMHQRLLVVPGTFGDWNASRSGAIEEQQDGIVAKLNGFWAWAQSEPLIVGINCWHWLTIPGLYNRSPGIIPFYYGVDHMPKLVTRLIEIGDVIRNHTVG